ncbi:High-affinity glucose transporter [Colletotrichum sp. SAR 10_99]|nr:High-affinity glucose transporter [Colletotrichum sp. SAR 10_96]KAJ5018688.1 High-affinity glucose transporter [Colletotrichum sp. SAR 10_99]
MAVLSLGPVFSHILIVLVAMLNICILSYDAGMINNLNAVKPYNDYFNLNSDLIGLNVAIISAGSVLGAPVVGPAVDRWGRKMGLAAGSICIIVGVILQASASAVPQLIVGRFIIGFASLVNGSIAPMWVMELASPKHRTICSSTVLVSVPFTSFLVACIVLGIFDKDSNWVWRGIMLATEILARLHADGDVHNVEVLTEAQEIVASLNQEKDGQGAWRELITPASNMKRFTIAVLTNIFYQILGGNMILYFSSYIISSLGVSSRRSIITINIALLLWKAFCSILGVFLIDRVGARKPLLAGTSATVILFGLLSGLSHLTEVHPDTNSYAIGSIVVVALFLLAVSTSWMILAYTYPPEILRYSQRAKGVVVAQAIGYAFSFLNLYTAPLAIERISWRYYAINSGWNLGILAVVYCLFVETKGRTLEEIDEVFDGVVYSNDVIIDAQGSKGTLEQDGEDNKSLTKRKLRKVDSAN